MRFIFLFAWVVLVLGAQLSTSKYIINVELERSTIGCYCHFKNPKYYHKECKCGCYDIKYPKDKAGPDGCCLKCAPPPEPHHCFHGDSQLLLDNGQFVKMKDLKMGQRILTVDDGRRIFSEVRTFLKRQPYENATYLTLTSEGGNQMTLSGNHLLFVSTNNKVEDMMARPASSVKRGDYIFSTNSCPDGLCPERVVQLSYSEKQGLYVPLTDTGSLVVDGMLASCYSFTSHDLEHFFTAPFRWFPWLLQPWQHDGYSPIMSGLEYLGEIFLPKSVLISSKLS